MEIVGMILIFIVGVCVGYSLPNWKRNKTLKIKFRPQNEFVTYSLEELYQYRRHLTIRIKDYLYYPILREEAEEELEKVNSQIEYLEMSDGTYHLKLERATKNKELAEFDAAMEKIEKDANGRGT